jgi:hypothetical protein
MAITATLLRFIFHANPTPVIRHGDINTKRWQICKYHDVVPSGQSVNAVILDDFQNATVEITTFKKYAEQNGLSLFTRGEALAFAIEYPPLWETETPILIVHEDAELSEIKTAILLCLVVGKDGAVTIDGLDSSLPLHNLRYAFKQA